MIQKEVGGVPASLAGKAGPGSIHTGTVDAGGERTAAGRRIAARISPKLCVALLVCLQLGAGPARADQGEEPVYHTPLAGEQREVRFMGRDITIPAIDRSHMTSITLGASVMAPAQGDNSALPIAAFYARRVGDRARSRAMVGIFVNELEYDRDLGGAELVAQFENYTLPVAETELLDGEEVEGTSLYFGTLLASVGPGWRLPVHPFQVDNDITVQLLARAGYFYAGSAHDTAPGLWDPPDTALYGARLRCRYDGMRRNLLELPHRGMATGIDLDYLYRDRWRGENGTLEAGNRDYLQVKGHLVGAAGLPGLSERDRFIFAAYGGHTGAGKGDRFNAFRINGAPFPSEEDDLAWPHYSGVIYNPFLARSYATATAGYRRELTFFLYLSALGSYLWADRADVEGRDRVVFRKKEGSAATVALDSAFLWDSSLYLAWSWDSGIIRNGRSGSGVTLMWNKLF